MPTSPNVVYRARIASTTGDAFVLASGSSGVYQIVMLSDQNENRINPVSEATLQNTNSLLSGQIATRATLTGSNLVGLSGQNLVFITNSGAVSFSLTGTPLVNIANQSIRVSFSGENLAFVTPSGTFNVTVNSALPAGTNNIGKITLETGSVNINGNVSLLAGSNLVGSFTLNSGVVQTSTVDSRVGVTGTTGLGLQVVSVSGWNSIPVWVPSGIIIENPIAIKGSVTLNTGAILATLNTGTVTVSVSNTPTVTINTGSISYDSTIVANQITSLTYFGTGITNSLIQIKATSGNLYNYHVWNPSANLNFIQFFDRPTGQITLGTTFPFRSYWLPAEGALDGDYSTPISFTGAIAIAVTNSMTGNGAPISGALVNIGYN